MTTDGHDIPSIVKNFQIDGELVEHQPWGNGHINATYRGAFRTAAGPQKFIHQWINQKVFKRPELLMENIQRVTDHLRRKLTVNGGDADRRTLTVVPALDGKPFHRTAEGDYWRTYLFIDGARTYEQVENLDHVQSAAGAFGTFQRQLADLPGGRLHDTIPYFHHTPRRMADLQAAIDKDAVNRAAAAKAEIDFALARQADTSVLVDLLQKGELTERITHNDTKFNNVMFDDATGAAICVIDLDTVMPGLTLYDFGDSVRIGASTAKEDEQDLSKVHCDLAMFERLVRGYVGACGDFLSRREVDLLAFSAKLITFEIGIRFLADFLDGDVYFRVHRAGHNLDRARTQFKMVAEMEQNAGKMQAIVDRYR